VTQQPPVTMMTTMTTMTTKMLVSVEGQLALQVVQAV